MSLAGFLYTRSQAVTAVTDVISTRFFPLKHDVAQPTFPFSYWEIIDGDIESAFGSDPGPTEVIVRIHSFTKTTDTVYGPNQLETLQDALKSAFLRFRGTLDGTTVQDIFFDGEHTPEEPERFVHHQILDLRIFHE